MEPEKRNKPIHSALVICERVITDKEDGVVSLIRIVDIFTVTHPLNLPAENRPVAVQAFFTARFPPNDKGDHSIEFSLERPDGEVVIVGRGETDLDEAKEQIPDAPSGLHLTTKFGVYPKIMGTHYIIVSLDGEEVQRAPFTRVRDLRMRICEFPFFVALF
jgi:hypothetical protein